MLAPRRPLATKFKYRLLYLGDDLELITALRNSRRRLPGCGLFGSRERHPLSQE